MNINKNILNPIICALDTTDLLVAKKLVSQLSNTVGGIKLGLEIITKHGIQIVSDFAESGVPIFLDLKFHDIPNTVAAAVRNAASLGVELITVHANGGEEMLVSAVEASREFKNPPKILAVTVLTSLDNNDLKNIGISSTPTEQVLRLASLSQKAGCDGVVCSPREISTLRENMGNNFMLVVPGIRPLGFNADDQKRTSTPQEALRSGANRLVIGRPITKSSNPRKAAENIVAELF